MAIFFFWKFQSKKKNVLLTKKGTGIFTLNYIYKIILQLKKMFISFIIDNIKKNNVEMWFKILQPYNIYINKIMKKKPLIFLSLFCICDKHILHNQDFKDMLIFSFKRNLTWLTSTLNKNICENFEKKKVNFLLVLLSLFCNFYNLSD